MRTGTRINSGGVYKGTESYSHYEVEYISETRDYSKVIMFVVIPLVLVAVYFLLTHIS